LKATAKTLTLTHIFKILLFQKLSAIILLTKSKLNNLGVDKNEY
ncbi:hypothetical protein HMPREF3209_01200, partial [Lactobacillus crispatus]